MEWKDVDKEVLEHLYYDEDLSDHQIAERFHISKGKVTYRRKKYNVTMMQRAIKKQNDV